MKIQKVINLTTGKFTELCVNELLTEILSSHRRHHESENYCISKMFNSDSDTFSSSGAINQLVTPSCNSEMCSVLCSFISIFSSALNSLDAATVVGNGVRSPMTEIQSTNLFENVITWWYDRFMASLHTSLQFKALSLWKISERYANSADQTVRILQLFCCVAYWNEKFRHRKIFTPSNGVLKTITVIKLMIIIRFKKCKYFV